MKSKIIVRLKESVLDPQGQTIHRALVKMGHAQVKSVRQGKYFELEFDGETKKQDVDEIRRLSEEIARKVLSNPIIEVFEIEEIS